ncbi:unnamed protein product [Debaryomyces fabryi]|nr:unnamed protein product [Debaryomyces fabryi]
MMGYESQFELKVAAGSNLPQYSDRAIFPPSILSSIIDSYSESSLPHPLIFKAWHNNNSCYIGVKEFSSNEGEILLPRVITDKLGASSDDIVKVELFDKIPKGKSLTLKPLQFYPQVHNWKFFLESKLTNFYTTLTKHTVLYIEDGLTVYELFVEAVDESSDTIGIIDTDIILDVIPLNDIMANQQLEFNKNFNHVDSNNINELFLNNELQIEDLKPFTSSDFRPQIYKLDLSNYDKSKPLKIKLTSLNNDYASLFNLDLVAGMDKLVNLENFRWTTMSDDFDLQFKLDNDMINSYEKVIEINMLQDDELLTKIHKIDDDLSDHYIYIVPFTWEFDGGFLLSITNESNISKDSTSYIQDREISNETVKCSNCSKAISKDKLLLHESFCLRNNVKCSCGLVFLKEIPETHWHCDKCNDITKYGSSALLKFKHDKLFHETSYKCNQCSLATEFNNFIDLVINHKAYVCPGKLHECRFCFLIVPQGESTFQDKVANLTNHENMCGNKTTECFKCNKILRTKDLSKHLKMHDLDKKQMNQDTKINFNKCLNENCIILIKDSSTNQLGLCDYCFGSIYTPQHDPTNAKLQSRIERKYMIQLTKGCGFSWCKNTNCKTHSPSRFASMSHKDLLSYINDSLFSSIRTPALPVNKSKPLPPKNRLWFCVNESIQLRKDILDLLSSENEYDEELIFKPINELSTVTEDSVREWLLHNGVKKM